MKTNDATGSRPLPGVSRGGAVKGGNPESVAGEGRSHDWMIQPSPVLLASYVTMLSELPGWPPLGADQEHAGAW